MVKNIYLLFQSNTHPKIKKKELPKQGITTATCIGITEEPNVFFLHEPLNKGTVFQEINRHIMIFHIFSFKKLSIIEKKFEYLG